MLGVFLDAVPDTDEFTKSEGVAVWKCRNMPLRVRVTNTLVGIAMSLKSCF